MNNRVTVSDTTLTVEPTGLDKMWSFTSRLEIPLEHVRGATHDPGMKTEPKGWRGPGLRIAGKLSGTFHADGERQFWNVDGFEKAVVITLDEAEPYNRVIATIADPEATVREITTAIQGRHG